MALDTTKHKNLLVKILKDVYNDNTVGPILGFKGGTAAHLFYNLDRFSVDLDFDLLAAEKEDYIMARMEEILARYGQIKTQRKKRYTLFFELSYAAPDRNIKVEINRRKLGAKYEVVNYYGIAMKVMSREDMFAGKLMAMHERLEKARRDIFDVWFFLQNDWPVNKELVEKRTGMSFKKFLAECIAKLEKIPAGTMLAGMGELLSAKQKIWAKSKLKTEALFLLRVMLGDEK